MPTPAEARSQPIARADPIARTSSIATTGALRLEVALRIGAHDATIALEPGHCERLLRMATCVALRDAALGPDETAHATVVAGRVRDRHGDVACLESCAVELADDEGRVVTRVEFPRAAFAAFAALRGTYLLAAGEEDRIARGGGVAGTAGDDTSGATPALAYSLHGHASDDAPVAITLPDLMALSLPTLVAGAQAHGTPDDAWIATVVTEATLEGLATLEQLSRKSGVETAARIRTRIGFDPARRCYVRVLESLVVAESADATATSVVSSAASWAPLLAGGAGDPRAPSSAHTHLHLGDRHRDPRGDELLAPVHPDAPPASLHPAAQPCISIADIVTHFTVFPDPLSALCVLSLFPDRSVLKIYGYTSEALLREEPGYWVLPARSASDSEATRRARPSRRRAPTHRPKGAR